MIILKLEALGAIKFYEVLSNLICMYVQCHGYPLLIQIRLFIAPLSILVRIATCADVQLYTSYLFRIDDPKCMQAYILMSYHMTKGAISMPATVA